MRNPHAGEPFTDSDDEIATALQDVSVPALLLSCVHMTEDDAIRREILDGPLRPAGIFPTRCRVHVPGGQGRRPQPGS